MKILENEDMLGAYLTSVRHLYWLVKALEILGVPENVTGPMWLNVMNLQITGAHSSVHGKVNPKVEAEVDAEYSEMGSGKPESNIREQCWAANVGRNKKMAQNTVVKICEEMSEDMQKIRDICTKDGPTNFNILSGIYDGFRGLNIWFFEVTHEDEKMATAIEKLFKNCGQGKD